MVETVRICKVLWIVMLRYAKDQILVVDTPGQQVPPRVRYRMTCLLIRVLWEVCLSQMSGNWCSYSLGPTWCKRGHGTTSSLRNLSIAMVL
jgi:hypothetical protein